VATGLLKSLGCTQGRMVAGDEAKDIGRRFNIYFFDASAVSLGCYLESQFRLSAREQHDKWIIKLIESLLKEDWS
jgi:hypothetical protein